MTKTRAASMKSRELSICWFVASVALFALSSFLHGCASKSNPGPALAPQPVQADSRQILETQTGLATFLHDRFHGRRSASGENFDSAQLVAAHPSYPLGTLVRVTCIENGRVVEVRVVDRGPSASEQKRGIIMDVSRLAAQQLDFVKDGKTQVRAEVLEWGSTR